jgi:putative transposase
MLSKWKRIFLESSSKIFEDPRRKDDKLLEKEVYISDLEKKVGQLTIERDWLKKNLSNSLDESRRKELLRTTLGEEEHLLSSKRKSELLSVSRKSIYSQKHDICANQTILDSTDEIYTDSPYF